MAYSFMWSALARCFCCAHVGTGSETTVEQESQQVRASGIDPSKCCVEYAEQYIHTFYEVESVFACRSKDLDGLIDIIISEKLSREISKNYEFAAVGSETDSNNDPESKLYVCDGGCTSTLTSSFENCEDCKRRITKIKTAEGEMVMETTHMCMQTFYVRTRTGEIRPITTKAFMCPKLGTDLLSVKGLNFQGYSVVHHLYPDEPGIFPLINGKTDKSQSFAFMSEHSNFFLSKSRTYVGASIRQDSGL